MSKIMVVEDDASLREIYGIRITAEGYDVVSAGDGEEALAVAVREKPDLILSDVMMPKISGFDMLDILRTTPETANIKVIMMTALSAEDQRQRGERLGANRYLVKSQVGIEDVINAIHEVLGDRPAASDIRPDQSTQSAQASQRSQSGQPSAQAWSRSASESQNSQPSVRQVAPSATPASPAPQAATLPNYQVSNEQPSFPNPAQ